MTILQSLDSYYGRMERRGEVVPPGWSTEPVGYVIFLKPDGSVSQVRPRLDDKGKRGLPTLVPKWFTKQGTGSTPFFLWENTAYALGVSEKSQDKTRRDHEAFRKLHLERLADTQDEELLALRRFVENWTPEQFVEPNFIPKMMAFNVAFRLDKPGFRRLIHEGAAARELIEAMRSEVSSEAEAYCLVSGEMRPVVRLHPKVKGVNGTANPEVPLVSFNNPAFESYGKEQGYNAPVSERAAFRYGAALNALLDRNKSRNRLQRGIGDATVIFWAESGPGPDDDHAAEAAEEVFGSNVNPPDEVAEASKLYEQLMAIADGKPVTELHDKLDPATRFHVLGLAPNAARLSVRFWLSDSLEHFIKNIARHYEDLRIEPQPVGWTLPSVSLLLARTTALLGKFDNIPHALAGEVMRSVLTGQPYPRTLVAAVIMRLRAGDAAGYGWHAAVLRACLNRGLRGSASREGEPMTEETEKKVPVGLDPENRSVAYQLGRLFSVMESAQYEALGRVNAPIGVRYYAAASATPARVFGTLLRGLKNHVADARKRNKGGWIDGRVSQILGHVGPDLPRTLSLEDQARFAVGYYHESGQRRAKAATNAAETTETEGNAE